MVRNVNRSAILNLVRERHPVSRAALSTLNNLNKSTVLSIVRELLEEKLIYETHNGEFTGGKKNLITYSNSYSEFKCEISVIKEIRSRVFFELSESRKVISTSLKERSSLVGAFTLAIKEIFKGYKITI